MHAKLVHIFSSGQAFQTKTVSQESCPRTAVPRRHRNMCLHDVNRSNTYWRLRVNTDALIRIAAWGGKEKKHARRCRCGFTLLQHHWGKMPKMFTHPTTAHREQTKTAHSNENSRTGSSLLSLAGRRNAHLERSQKKKKRNACTEFIKPSAQAASCLS